MFKKYELGFTLYKLFERIVLYLIFINYHKFRIIPQLLNIPKYFYD